MTVPPARSAHWDRVYERPADAVSWYQPEAKVSRELIGDAQISLNQPIIDVGGGASNLVDGLVESGFQDITVLDISERALSVARQRLGSAAAAVHFIAADITAWVPARTYRCWHDRAVFHFLVEAEQRQAYRDCLARAVEPGGAVLVATFAEDGPERCSGLVVRRYSIAELEAELRTVAVLVDSRRQLHRTPSGAEQSFVFGRFQRL